MITRCFSVRLINLERISIKAYKATAFDGSSDIIPSSQVFGRDLDIDKCDAYWISAWILSKKNIQYSHKKEAFFNENGKRLPSISVDKHIPEKMTPVEDNSLTTLKK